MNRKLSAVAFASGLLLAAAHASAATVLTFEDLAEGAQLSNQYAAMGVLFSANAFSGAGGPNGNWATNTGMTITSTDIGALGAPSLVSGKLLHSYLGDWLSEDGDASFLITFTTPISSFSADFAGINFPDSTTLTVFSGATVLATIAATTTGQQTLAYTGPGITSVAVTPGDYFDWVGVDNITFTQAVPEPGTYALMALGVAALGFKLRRRG